MTLNRYWFLILSMALPIAHAGNLAFSDPANVAPPPGLRSLRINARGRVQVWADGD